jgi:hypothetical protein
MATAKEFESKEELLAHLIVVHPYLLSNVSVFIEEYGHDKRTGWNTFIIHQPGYGVLGFTNKMVDEVEEK